MISIIVPIYNEESMLAEACIDFQKLAREVELIFVDGESTDASIGIARQYGKVFSCKRSRALQMNYGASRAQGDILLFLHADNIISPEALQAIDTIITDCGYAGGCLTQKIDANSFVYRLIELQGNARARMTKEFYGDQGIFVRKDIFFNLGGFPEVPVMEDVIFTRKLKAAGKTVVLSDEILVSARRWQKSGIIKTALFFNLILLLSRFKVPLTKIKMLYPDLR